MFGKGNAMVSMASIFPVLTLTIRANPAYFHTSSSIVNPEYPYNRINTNEKPFPEQKKVSVKMCQIQYKPLENQRHTRFKFNIGWKLGLMTYYSTDAVMMQRPTYITSVPGIMVR
jgi:hypothetical protein